MLLFQRGQYFLRWVYAAPRPRQRSFSVHLIANTEIYSWAKYKNWVSVECSATNGTPESDPVSLLSSTGLAQGSLQKRRWKGCKSQRAGRIRAKWFSEHSMAAVLITQGGCVVCTRSSHGALQHRGRRGRMGAPESPFLTEELLTADDLGRGTVVCLFIPGRIPPCSSG